MYSDVFNSNVFNSAIFKKKKKLWIFSYIQFIVFIYSYFYTVFNSVVCKQTKFKKYRDIQLYSIHCIYSLILLHCIQFTINSVVFKQQKFQKIHVIVEKNFLWNIWNIGKYTKIYCIYIHIPKRYTQIRPDLSRPHLRNTIRKFGKIWVEFGNKNNFKRQIRPRSILSCMFRGVKVAETQRIWEKRVSIFLGFSHIYGVLWGTKRNGLWIRIAEDESKRWWTFGYVETVGWRPRSPAMTVQIWSGGDLVATTFWERRWLLGL